MKNKKGKRKSRREAQSGANGPPVTAQIYKGPVITTKRSEDLQLITAVLSNVTTIVILNTQTSIGVILSSDCHGWSQFVNYNVYDAYRVLAMEIEYLPTLSGTGLGATGFLPITCCCVCDYDDATANLSTIQGASNYESFKSFCCGNTIVGTKTWKYSKWKANGADLMQFSTVAGAPTKVGSIKTLFSSGSAATSNCTVGTLVQRALVQFRGRN